MREGHRRRTIGALAALLALTVVSSAAGGTITLGDTATHFSISAKAGSTLHFSKGVYRIVRGGTTIGFSQTKTTVSSTAYGSALLSALGGTTVTRKTTGSRFAATVKAGGHTESVLVLDRAPGS